METLPVYPIDFDTESYQSFLRGEPPDAEKNVPWYEFMAEQVAAGKRFYRVRIVASPLNEYLRYEFGWGYPHYEKRGSEVFVLDVTERGRPDGLPDEDFYLLDDERVLRMHYDDEGIFLGASYAPAEELPRYRRYRDLGMAAAVPFPEYWAAHPEYHPPTTARS